VGWESAHKRLNLAVDLPSAHSGRYQRLTADAMSQSQAFCELCLRSGTDNYLAYINIGRLFDREGNGAGNCIQGRWIGNSMRAEPVQRGTPE
jgi:hypothetical protein